MQIYDDEATIADVVANLFSQALLLNQPCVIIARSSVNDMARCAWSFFGMSSRNAGRLRSFAAIPIRPCEVPYRQWRIFVASVWNTTRSIWSGRIDDQLGGRVRDLIAGVFRLAFSQGAA